MEHREKMLCPPFNPGGDAVVLFQTAHQPLDSVSLMVEDRIEAMPAIQRALVAPAWDYHAHASSSTRPPHAREAVSLVIHNSSRPMPGTPRADAPHVSEFQERIPVEPLMPLSGGKDEGHRHASAFSAQVDLGGESAS